MKNKIMKNYLYNLSYQILILILPLITTPYVSRVLGAENIGIYSYTISISTYFILFGSLGVAMYGQREIAYLQDDNKKYSTTFWEIVLLRLSTMFVAIIVFYFTFVTNGKYSVYFKVLILELIANCLDISWFFQGLEEFKKTVFRNTLVKIISIICIFTFVRTGKDLLIYFVIYALSILIGNISLWAYLPRYLVEPYKINVFKHFKPTLKLFIPQIAIQIYTVLDKVMIGTIVPLKAEVGFYEQSQKIIKMLLTVITSLGTVMVPRMANTFMKGDHKKIQEYMNKSFNFVFLLAFPMIFGIIAVSNKFVPLFFGSGYNKVIVLMQVISPILLFIGLSNVIGTQYLLPTKRQKEFTISVVCGACTNFILNYILINYYQSLGASIATVFAEFIVTLIQFVLIRKIIDINKIFKISIKYFLSSVIMFFVCFGISFIKCSGIINILIQVSVGGIIYLVCLIIMKDDFVLLYLLKINNRIKKHII